MSPIRIDLAMIQNLDIRSRPRSSHVEVTTFSLKMLHLK